MAESEIIYGLAAFCFLLGFIALLKQKTYVDSQTNRPTEVELPLVGKLKSNYPALVFVAVGAFLAYLGGSKPSVELGEEDWTIIGSFVAPKNVTVKWEEGNLALMPNSVHPAVHSDGNFEIQVSIPKGKTFEDIVSAIIYTNGPVSGRIDVVDEFTKRENGSLPQSEPARSRHYSPQPVTVYHPESGETP
jgi:hypothetical protein